METLENQRWLVVCPSLNMQFRLYSDVLFIHYIDDDSDFYVVCAKGDAKNGYGEYGGQTEYEVYVDPDGAILAYVDEEDSQFIGAREKYFS